MNSNFLVRISATVCLSLLWSASAFGVATITIVNNDGAGEGFNDPTPFTAIGGNPATNLGEARLLAFQHAAFLWGSLIQSDVDIEVDASFDPLPCNATSAVLGAAGPNTVHRDYAGAPLANTWYVQALANSLAGVDLDPLTADAGAFFNGDIDTVAGCLTGTTWYYGLDGNPGVGQIDFVTVIVHELTHALGFLSLLDCETTGEKFLARDDVYSNFLSDVSAAPSAFSAMTDAQRLTACRNGPDVVWTGGNVTTEAAAIPLSAGTNGGQAQIFAPDPFSPGSSISHFDSALVPNELQEPSYTDVDHTPGLTLPLFEDIGWGTQPPFGVDIVFLMDLTGSAGSLIPTWLTEIPSIATAWQDFDPNAEFALTTHRDYPFAPHANANEWAYQLESALDPDPNNLVAALNNVANMMSPAPGTGGLDAPESQYEAIMQILTGEGRELTPPVNFTDQGEIPQSPVGQDSPMVIYHFTEPVLFHDRDTDPDYPFAGAADSRPGIEIPGRTRVVNEMAAQSALNMFFGLTFVSGRESWDEVRARGGMDPLQELSGLTGGGVLDVGSGLGNLQKAIVESIAIFETSPQNGDEDADGIFPPEDNCPETANLDQADFDGDGVGDACDNCIATPNANQEDLDFNGAGDVCNCLPGTDADGDSICNANDMCPSYAQADITQLDTDEDGIPNDCECGDFDSNGLVNTLDARLTQRCATGEIPCDFPLCDVNDDGNCNTLDARLVQRFAVGELSKKDLGCAARPFASSGPLQSLRKRR